MNRIFTVFLILFFLCSPAIADNFNYEALRSEYYRLKNTDPKIKKTDKWLLILKQYQEASLSKAPYLTDRFYLDYSILLKELFSVKNDPAMLESAMDNLDLLVERFPDSELADDAILKKSELLVMVGASQELVDATLEDLISKYPQTDSAQAAIFRVKQQDKQETVPAVADNRSLPVSDLNLPVVVIDPGHGGEDFGAESDTGLLEKDVALAIGLELERFLIKHKIAKPVLTRRIDQFVPLAERVEIANKNKAALFISLHSNASPQKNQHGLTTYILDNSTDEASRLLAERENKSVSASEVSDLQFILGDLIQASKHPKSALLAEILEKQIVSTASFRMKHIKNNKVKKAPFFVLVGAQMPCVLLELFLLIIKMILNFCLIPSSGKILHRA